MVENITVVKEVIKSLKDFSEISVWNVYKNLIKSNKKIPRKEWQNLLKIVRTRELYKILKIKMTTKEARFLGSALIKSRLCHLEDIVDLIIQKDDNCVPVLIKCILEKKSKFDMTNVHNYLRKMIKNPIKLVHIEILKVVEENYPNLIDKQILEFCRNNNHEICKKIISSRSMEIL